MLKKVLEGMDCKCALGGQRFVVVSAPQEGSELVKRIVKLLESWEDISLTLSSADLVLSDDPVVEVLLHERELRELRNYALELLRDPSELLSHVEAQHGAPAPILEAMHRFIVNEEKDELRTRIAAYLEAVI